MTRATSKETRNPSPPRLWYLYLLACADGTTYTGITTDPQRRLRQHNAGRAARYTAVPKRRPVRLLGVWRFPDRGSATRAEIHLKQRRAARKRRLAAERESFEGAPFCPEYVSVPPPEPDLKSGDAADETPG